MRRLILMLLALAPLMAQAAMLRGMPSNPRFLSVGIGVEPLGTVGGLAIGNAGTFTNTQMNEPAQVLLNGLSPLAEFQIAQGAEFATDALLSGMTVPSGSTVYQANALTGYVKNTSPSTAAVAAYAQARCAAAASGARCWGANLVVTDVTDAKTAPSVTSTLYGLEVDTDPMNTGDGADGVLSVFNPSLLSNYVGGTAFLAAANSRAAGDVWHTGFATQDGGAADALDVGAACTTGTCGSQNIQLLYYAAGTEKGVFLSADSAGNLVVPPIRTSGALMLTSTGVTCTMASGTTCTATVPSGSNHCLTTAQGTSVTYYGVCSVSGTTATVTANASNSDNWLIIPTT